MEWKAEEDIICCEVCVYEYVIKKNDTEIKLRWGKFYSGQFILEHVTKTGNIISKTIVVETLY